MNEFPYTLIDVLGILGISYKRYGENRIKCPFCNGRGAAMGINTQYEQFHCFSCGIKDRGPTKFYAYYRGISTKEAHKEIMNYLNLNEQTLSRPERKIDAPKEIKVLETVDEEVRNHTYLYLLNELPLEDEDKEELLSRGFELSEIFELGYKTYPYKEEGFCMDYVEVPKKLQSLGCKISGVPGFYLNKKGKWSLCKRPSGIVMPCRGFHNNIKSLQIRLRDRYIDEETGGKCRWVSTPFSNKGAAKIGSVHYSVDFMWNREKTCFEPINKDGSIVLTEGYMKADLFHCITSLQTISVPGVEDLNELSEELHKLKSLGFHILYDCYDMDYITNKNVQNAIERLKEICKQSDFTYKRKTWKTDVDGCCLKGIDDFYAYYYRGVKTRTKDNAAE